MTLKVIPVVWEVAEDQPGSSSAKLTFQWNASDAAVATGFSLSGGTHVIGHFRGGNWQQQLTNIGGSGPFTTQSIEPYTTFSTFVIAMDSTFSSAGQSENRVGISVDQATVKRDEQVGIGLKVYPNPTVSWLSVLHPAAASGAFIRITSVDGRLLRRTVIRTGDTQTVLNVAAFSGGSYVLYFESGGRTLVSRFVR